MVTKPPDIFSARDVAVTLEVDGVPTRVLDGVALELARSEVVDIVGPSGSGKSTLLRVLACLLPGATGTLSLAGGETPESLGAQVWRSRVALVPQKPVVVDDTVRGNLLLPWRLKVRHGTPAPDDDRLRAELDALALDAVHLDRSASKLSVGQLARVALARTLLSGPTVLLLDEADAALDAESACAVGERVARFAAGGDRAVIRVRHRDDDGLAARRLRLADGSLQEVPR